MTHFNEYNLKEIEIKLDSSGGISWDKLYIPNMSDYSIKDYDSKWVERWFERASQVASWSKDPSTKVGVVIVNEETKQELSAGYNGFPRGIKDDERLNNREIKYKLVTHAEMNCLFNACRTGVSLFGHSIFVWGLPVCSECAKGIIQVGISRVYVKEEFLNNERWRDAWELTQQMFDEAGVKVIII